jgi:hypothetical protein
VNLLFSFAKDSSQQNAWWHPWNATWLGDSLYLSFLVGTLAVSIVALCLMSFGRFRENGNKNLFGSIFSQLLLAVAIWVIFQTAGHTFLDWSYFAYPLIFPTFLALGAIISMGQADKTMDLKMLSIITILLLLIIPLSFGARFLVDFAWQRFRFLQWNLTLPALLVFIAGLIFLSSRRFASVTFATALLGIANLPINIKDNHHHALTAVVPTDDYAFNGDCPKRKQTFEIAMGVFKNLRAISIEKEQLIIWYDYDETIIASPGCAAITMRSDLGGPVSQQGFKMVEVPWNVMPKLSEIGASTLKSWAAEHRTIVFLTQNDNSVDEMASRIRGLGLAATKSNAGIVEYGQARIRIDLLSFQ